jgi:chromosome segregation ATPase
VASLEERVTAMEQRAEQLATENEHSTDIAVVAAREALTAREAHQKNIELLNALRKSQAEHSRTLAEHSRILADHSRILTEHSRTLAEHTTQLDSIDVRLDSIDGKLGVVTVGVHSIESLLARLVNDAGQN